MAKLEDLVLKTDPFSDMGDTKTLQLTQVHIRNRQRTARKSWTTIEGLSPDIDLAFLLKALRKTLNTNGTLLHNERLGHIIQLQGDHRSAIMEFLVNSNIVAKDRIILHGT